MLSLIVALALAQQPSCIAEAATRAEAFNLTGAIEALDTASASGCEEATVASVYLQGLSAARRAYAQGGSAESLRPVQEAIASLERHGADVPGPPRIAALVLRAASAAAQSERDEMALFLAEAIRLEALQIAAGQPPAPIISAHEAAGDLWLQVHRFDDARRAYDEAVVQVGANPRIAVGRARLAARSGDVAACAVYRNLLDWWGKRPGEPPEIAEARGYVLTPSCVRPGR